jgi:hypothetical protein
MNLLRRLELTIYKRLLPFPRIKRLCSLLWQCLWSSVTHRRTMQPAKCLVYPNMFFGFHDKSPWDSSGKWLAGHRPVANRMAQEMEIGIVDTTVGEFRCLAQTRTWNWQQGSQLQWLKDGRSLIFNNVDAAGHAVCEIADLAGHVEVAAKCHVAALHQSSGLAASFCFSRLGRVMPDYGYRRLQAHREPRDLKSLHGLSALDIYRTSNWECLRSYTFGRVMECASLKWQDKMRVAIFNCSFAPTSNHLAFFLVAAVGGTTRLVLMVLDLRSDLLCALPIVAPSHYCWSVDDHLFVTHFQEPRGWLCERFSADGAQGVRECIDLPFGDGHPNYSPARGRLLIDSYPDRYRRQHLMSIDWPTRTIREEASLRSPLRFTGADRCDCHPRWHPAGLAVCVDTAHSGLRSMMTIAL